MDKKLLTPGPLTTSYSTKEAMLHDWGSRDKIFIDLNHSIRQSLLKLIDGLAYNTTYGSHRKLIRQNYQLYER